MIDVKEGRRPVAEPDDDLVEAFWAHCTNGELCFQRCASCGTWRHLPRLLCSKCGSKEWSWELSSGRGKIFSWTVTCHPIVPHFPEPVPYAVIVVELEEGVRMVSGLRDLDPEKLEIDLPVEVIFEPVNENDQLPFFRPRG